LPQFHEGTTMPKSMHAKAARKGDQTIFFQIANGNSRQACSLKTKFPTEQQASRYLRQNWNRIEQMARDCLAKGSLDEGQVKLVMI